MTTHTIVVLTALNSEYRAVRRHLSHLRKHRHEKGTRFELGTIPDTPHQVALGLADKGNHRAAVMAERALTEFDPLAVLFVGVAGGLLNTPLGDVVVASKVYGYHGGTSEDDGLKARPEAWQLDHGLSQLAQELGRSGGWATGIQETDRTPAVHFAPIAAGEVVQNSGTSREAVWLREHFNDARAVEMEGAGVAQAGQLNGAPVAVIRGISDHADGTKTTAADAVWQPRAADHAAAFAIRLARERAAEEEHSPMSRQHDPGPRYVQKVDGGSVAIQGSTVTNSVVAAQNTDRDVDAPTDLRRELMDLRTELEQLRARNELDAETAHAAQTELDTASATLTDPDSTKKSFVLALRRLYGVVMGVTDFAAKVATLITAAEALP
ncbi:nucleoside phosphorylase [Prauserella isguenensis]|uniref:Nucleoside phosphorylase n=1 Tax=Prauserella isguenensis TaxID=1470180 RepID=A0A839S3F9_9PSEU|nr:5'-methylthioadenosine/S-adenosylhomocysteine nucleosidase [Prauserella isguenensis]MBB3051237.1 nucleoside phosphorylase [Prauserella isguenensis]